MRETTYDKDSGLFSPLLSDGRYLLTFGTLGLLISGGFALFLAASGQFLPHDIQFLQMTAADLCSHDGCRIVHFMIHDRVSFGGALIGLSVLYFWLIHFPLRARFAWAWWTLLISNIAGFASFFAYLAYGYLDRWHAVATIALLPCFVIGFVLTYGTLNRPRAIKLILRGESHLLTGRSRLGWFLLLATGTAMIAAGFTISIVGMTVVFVPQDLQYMDTTSATLDALNPRLIPLIAHDRAGFGAAVLNVGFLIVACTWYGIPSRSLWQAFAITGGIGFTLAIGIHPVVGYNNPVHLAPACLGAMMFLVGICLTAPQMLRTRGSFTSRVLAGGIAQARE